MKIKVYGSTVLSRMGEGDQERDVDSGWAWIVLFASFMANAIILGANFAFSVFYVEWTEYFGRGPTATSMLISVSCALILAAGKLPCSLIRGKLCYSPITEFL